MYLRCGNTIRLPKDKERMIRQEAARNGYAVAPIRTQEELVDALNKTLPDEFFLEVDAEYERHLHLPEDALREELISGHKAHLAELAAKPKRTATEERLLSKPWEAHLNWIEHEIADFLAKREDILAERRAQGLSPQVS